MSVKSEKDKQKVTQEKYQAILCELLKQEDNKYCVDCDAKGEWTVLPFLAVDFRYMMSTYGDMVSIKRSLMVWLSSLSSCVTLSLFSTLFVLPLPVYVA